VPRPDRFGPHLYAVLNAQHTRNLAIGQASSAPLLAFDPCPDGLAQRCIRRLAGCPYVIHIAQIIC
jgi:hypothetical protein